MFTDYPSDLADFAARLAGNHRKFTSFGWSDRPADDHKWGICYTHNRDSGIVEQSNASVIAALLDKPEFSADVKAEHHGHWACGWVDGYAVRVYSDAGEVTPVVAALRNIAAALADYPILDESDVSEREYSAALENIATVGRRMVRDDAPESWPGEVYGWLSANDESAIEDSDGNGAYPSDDSVREALESLGYLESESE